VDVLEIDYVVSFAVNNVDSTTFVDSPALTTITTALTLQLTSASFASTLTTDLTTTDATFVGFTSFAAEMPVVSVADLAVVTTQGAPSAQPTKAPVDSNATASSMPNFTFIAGAAGGGLLFIALVTWFKVCKKKQIEVLPDANNLELGSLVAVDPTPQSQTHQRRHHHGNQSPSSVVPMPLST